MQNKLMYLLVLAASLSIAGCLPEDEKGDSRSDSGNQGQTTPDFDTDPAPDGPTTPPVVLPEPPVVPPQGDDGIVLNDGALVTTDDVLRVALYKFEGVKMKVSFNAECTGGNWGNYNERFSLPIPAEYQNGLVHVSVRFTDYDAFPSACFHTYIVHDNQAPNILFTKYPTTALKDGEATELIYEVTDAGSGVDTVTCDFNGVTRACTGGRTIVTIPGMAPGAYVFTVRATDKAGHATEKAITWQVVETTRKVTHTINVDEYRKWDILFIIDNSGSMNYEQRSMAERTRNFLSVMRGLDWQIAVTTTDTRNVNLGDGRFIPLVGGGGESILRSSTNEAQAQTILSNTLQRPETGSSLEQGVKVTYRVVERSLTPGTSHAAFFRSGAHFAVVLISDEDESDNTTKNDPQSLMNFVTSTFNGQKNFLFNSIITIPGDRACLNGEGESYGERYKMMTELSKGVMGSVCESDYAAQMTGIAEKVRNMAKTFTLACAPLPDLGISIKKNGQAFTAPYTIDGVKMNFNDAIDPGSYELEYHCLR